MTETLKKRTSKGDLKCFDKPKFSNYSDVETNEETSKSYSHDSLYRTKDGNTSRETVELGTALNMTDNDISIKKQNNSCDTSLNKADGYDNMNRQNVFTDPKKAEGDVNQKGETDGWGVFLNKTGTKDNVKRHADGWGTTLSNTGGWGSTVSPGRHEAWRRHSPTISPNAGWSKSSRSRSPRHGLRHGSESWDTRASNPAQLCRDYAAGKCRRGRQCRFIHDDSVPMHPNSELSDMDGSRFKRGRYSVHDDREMFTDLWEQRDCSGTKFSESGENHLDADYEQRARRYHASKYGGDYMRHSQRHGSKYGDEYENHSQRHGSKYGDDYKQHSQRHVSLCDDDFEKHSQRHKSHDGDHVNREQHRMSRTAISCYAFSKGKCQRGSACRFAHIDSSSDGELLMDNNSKEKIQDRRDTNASSRQGLEPLRTHGSSCKYSAEGHHCRGDCGFYEQSVPKHHLEGGLFDNKSADNDVDNDNSLSRSGPKWDAQDIDNNSSRNGGKLGDQKTLDASDSSHFRYDDYNTRGITDSINREGSTEKAQPLQSPQEAARIALPAQELNNVPSICSFPGHSRSQGQQNETLVPQETHEGLCSVNIQNQLIVPPFSSVMQFQQPSDTETSNFKALNQQSHPSIPFRLIQQNLNFSGPSLECLPQVLNSEQITDSHTPNGSTACQTPTSAPNSGGPCHQVNPHHCSSLRNMQNYGDESRSITHKSVLSSAMNEVVATCHLSQMTNIPASLLAGNDKHLSHCHSSFKSISATCSSPSQPYSDLNSVRPPAPSLILDFHNPRSRVSSKFVEAKDQMEESETNLKSLASISVVNKSHNGNLHKDSAVNDCQYQGNNESKPVEVNPDFKEVEGRESMERPTEDVDAAVHTNCKDRRGKDEKGIFKVALVEFVKELLKPTWKEGSLSKEAHKTIVKKVVEKVMRTMPGPAIPNTKERIDFYLSLSKTKIEKLVQAYVERYVKISILA